MAVKLIWFNVQLALLPVYEGTAGKIVQEFQIELDARPHLRNPHVFWEQDRHRIIIQFEIERVMAERVANEAMEEMHEVSYAVLSQVRGMHLEVLNIQPAAQN